MVPGEKSTVDGLQLLAWHLPARTPRRSGAPTGPRRRYFGNKAQLFDAALDIDLRVPDLTGAPPAELPRLIVRHFLDRWESDPGDDALLVLMRSAVTNEHAAAQMRAIFAGQVAPALAAALGPDVAKRRAGMVSAP